MKKQTKKWFKRSAIAFGSVAAIAIPVTAVACGSSASGDAIANITYRASDPFIKVYADRINAKLGTTYQMLTGDGAEQQTTQNNLIDTFINRGVKALIINPVLPSSVGVVISKAKAANLPLVLYNREAAAGTSGTDLSARESTMAGYDKVAYVGIQAATQGEIQAQLVYDDIKAKRLKDNNGDGKLKFAIIRGQAGHPDAIDRSNAFLPKLRSLVAAEQIQLVKPDNTVSVTITSQNFNTVFPEVNQDTWTDWSAAQGQQQSQALLNANADLELFVCNNDDTATGVVSSLKAKNKVAVDLSTYPTATNINNHVGLYGVDATPNGLANVRDGWFNGTVLNNNLVQADLIDKLVRDVLGPDGAWKTTYDVVEPYSGETNTYTMVERFKAFYVPSNPVATYLNTWDSFKPA